MASALSILTADLSDDEISDQEGSRHERDPKRARSQDRDEEELFQSEQSSTHENTIPQVSNHSWMKRGVFLMLLLVPTAQAVRNGPHALVSPYAHRAPLLPWSQAQASNEDVAEEDTDGDAPEGYIILEQELLGNNGSKYSTYNGSNNST